MGIINKCCECGRFFGLWGGRRRLHTDWSSIKRVSVCNSCLVADTLSERYQYNYAKKSEGQTLRLLYLLEKARAR